ncbi:MAG: hypothetical protein ACP6IY_20620 [Promethearchaeia archaeon]
MELDELNLNFEFDYDWPNEIKYILSVIDLLEDSIEIHNELEQRIKKLLEEKQYNELSKKRIIEKLNSPNVKNYLKVKEKSLNKSIHYKLRDARQIRKKLLKCISILQEVILNNLNFTFFLNTSIADDIAIAISSLDWLVFRIDVKNSTLRIREESGLIEVLLVLRSKISKLSALFNDSAEEYNADKIINLLDNLNPQERGLINLKTFDPKFFSANAPLELKERTMGLIAHSLKGKLNSDLILGFYNLMSNHEKINFIKGLVGELNEAEFSYLKELITK